LNLRKRREIDLKRQPNLGDFTRFHFDVSFLQHSTTCLAAADEISAPYSINHTKDFIDNRTPQVNLLINITLAYLRLAANNISSKYYEKV
jgi:hypothetical protein